MFKCGTCKYNCRKVSIHTDLSDALDTRSSSGTHEYGGYCKLHQEHYTDNAIRCSRYGFGYVSTTTAVLECIGMIMVTLFIIACFKSMGTAVLALAVLVAYSYFVGHFKSCVYQFGFDFLAFLNLATATIVAVLGLPFLLVQFIYY